MGGYFLCLLMTAWSGAVLAQSAPVVGDISGAEFRPYPVAIPALRVAEGQPAAARVLAETLTEILRNDLDLSGVFRVLNPKSFIDTDGIERAEVRFEDWLQVGADGLVKGQIVGRDEGLAVEVHGYQVARQSEGFTQTYPISEVGLRAKAHGIADDLYRYFIGEPGVFRTKIAYVRKVNGEKQIFTMDMDGKSVSQITSGGGLNLLPSFSADGSSILYTSYRYDNPDLFEIGAEGGAFKRISRRPGLNTGAKVSPDNDTIALTLSQDGNSELYLIDRRGDIVKRLTQSWGIDTSPAWSPDGKKIAFVSSRAGNPHIYLLDIQSGDTKRLTFQGTYNQTPAFSPRGDIIAFTARDEFNRFDIFTLHIASGKVSRITQDQGNNEEPTFAPHGRLLAFTSTRSGSRQVWLSSLDGKHQRQLTTEGDHSSPAWSPFPGRKP